MKNWLSVSRSSDHIDYVSVRMVQFSVRRPPSPEYFNYLDVLESENTEVATLVSKSSNYFIEWLKNIAAAGGFNR